MTGCLTPSPERCGGGAPLIKQIVDALNAEMGTAYDTSGVTSNVYIESLAYARCIAAAREAVQRLANQWDPYRMTDFLPRWERFLSLVVLPTDAALRRRQRVGNIWAQWGESGKRALVRDTLVTLLGNNLVELEYASPSDVLAWWPGGSASPYGFDWYSTYAHLRIKVQRIATQTEAQFQAAMSSINPAIDAIVPAWVTWDWYLLPNGFSASPTSGFVVAGAAGDGYEINLGYEAFD